LERQPEFPLLPNAVVAWNALQIGRIVEELREQGEVVRDEDLAHLSPLRHEHIIATGTY
jgi:TnpA family transposase